jgi:hypothetical protein
VHEHWCVRNCANAICPTMISPSKRTGDMAGATMGTYIITRALKFNMPKRLVVRMLANQAIDSVCGIVPFVGDIFDIGYKVRKKGGGRAL